MNDAKETLLIIDDEASNIAVLREALKDDYRIRAATSGRKALELLAKEVPDLILTDVLMPEMNGYELCREIKAMPEYSGIPLLFVSGLDRTEEKTEGFAAGGVDYITKPFEIPEVRARVATHLELQRSRKRLEENNRQLQQAADFREEVERITRHDLKSPLQAMIGLPDLMLYEDNLTPDQRDNLEMIKDSAKNMLRMINLGLDLFKMETGMYKLQAQPIPLYELLERIVKEREYQHGTDVPISLSGEAGTTIHGEELLLYSLFQNLVQNAWEASGQGQAIEISVGRLVAAGDGVRSARATATVRVANHGEVPAAIRDRFFEKYVTAGKENGTGLGTYSAALIARTHAGTIELDSTTAGHTTIVVHLPLAADTGE